jgi:hypothetical protein
MNQNEPDQLADARFTSLPFLSLSPSFSLSLLFSLTSFLILQNPPQLEAPPLPIPMQDGGAKATKEKNLVATIYFFPFDIKFVIITT